MSDYPHSLVTICPDANRDALLALGEAYGVSGGLDVPLSVTGVGPVTHWGARADASAVFVAILTKQIQVPVEGYTPEQVTAVLDAADYYVDTDGKSRSAHFAAVLAMTNLRVVEPEN